MNVYVYGGPNRFDATESVVGGNAQAVVGRNYTVDATKGMLIVAYPNEYVQTEFEFKYYIANHNSAGWTDMIVDWNFNYDNGDTVFIVFVTVAAIVLICLICFCFCICKRCFKRKGRIEIIDDDVHLGTHSPRPHNGNDTSV